jgi:hypothetical protein
MNPIHNIPQYFIKGPFNPAIFELLKVVLLKIQVFVDTTLCCAIEQVLPEVSEGDEAFKLRVKRSNMPI